MSSFTQRRGLTIAASILALTGCRDCGSLASVTQPEASPPSATRAAPPLSSVAAVPPSPIATPKMVVRPSEDAGENPSPIDGGEESEQKNKEQSDRFPVRHLEPIDESDTDPSFQAFRTRLLDAIQKRDLAFIKRIMDPDGVQASFGDSDFLEYYGLAPDAGARPGASDEFWKEIQQAIQLGCTPGRGDYGKANFSCPYVYSRWPHEPDGYDFSGYEFVVSISPSAGLYADPKDKEPFAQLRYEIVKRNIDSDDGTGDWLQVTTGRGEKGFVKREDVRSPIDFRAGFRKHKQSWRIWYFIAGD